MCFSKDQHGWFTFRGSQLCATAPPSQFRCQLSPKGPCVEGFLSRWVYIRLRGRFRGWGVAEGLQIIGVYPQGELENPCTFSSSVYGSELSSFFCHMPCLAMFANPILLK